MGKSITPKYRIESKSNDAGLSSVWIWDTKRDGRANQENLEKWRVAMNESFKFGGVNYNISLAKGILVHITYARIVEQKTRRVVCDTTMPMFEII